MTDQDRVDALGDIIADVALIARDADKDTRRILATACTWLDNARVDLKRP